MSILFGLITLFLSILIPTLVLVFTDFQIMGFSLVFIIPVGAIAIGYLCGLGYFKGLVKSNIYITKKHFLIGLMIALLCIFGLKYAEYALTYVDPTTGDITYSFIGEDHISNYEMEGYGPLTFINYTKLIIESTPISFSYKARSLGEISNPTVSWIFAIIDYLGVIAGCLYVGISEKSRPYCQNCQLYNKKLPFIKIPRADGAKFFEDLSACYASANVEQEVLALLEQVKSNTLSKRDEHFLGTLIYCDSCNTASMSFELFELNSKKQLVANSNFKHSIEIEQGLSHRIIHEMSA